MAERVGFEPTVDLHLRRISSAVHSTTLPPLHKGELRKSLEKQDYVRLIHGDLRCQGRSEGVSLLKARANRKPFYILYEIFIMR